MTRHNYRAIMEGRKIIVTDESGAKVKCQFGATSDSRTVYAYLPGIGFIGGWQYPHRKMPWCALAASINQGRLYGSTSELPNGRRRWQ